jgi:peptidoglycan hydrolase-like protein with peptidoglycan-binding domain
MVQNAGVRQVDRGETTGEIRDQLAALGYF